MGAIANIVFCETANNVTAPNGELKFTASGLLARGNVLSIPSFFSLSVIMLFLADRLEARKDVKLIITNPDGVQILTADFDLNTMPKPQAVSGGVIQDLILTINLQNLVIDSIGEYRFMFYLNSVLEQEKNLLISVKEMIK